jgi:hypothetical protein
LIKHNLITRNNINNTMSEEEVEICSMCSVSFEQDKHDYFCNKCSESIITLWTCQRCNNIWSPDYYTEEIYSDCCHPMMEGYNVDIDSIKYCSQTGDTVWDGDKSCKECDKHDEKCGKILKAYIFSECKLIDYC